MDNPDAQYAIFDDIAGGIKFFPRFKDWLGGQMQFTLKQLYKEPALFTWGKPSIWLSNTDPRDQMGIEDIQWLEGNCTIVYVSSPIFHASTE